MSLSIIKRSPLLTNLIVFISFVLVYVYISLSLYEQNSILEKSFAIGVLRSHYPLIVLYFVTLISIWFAAAISKIFLAAYLLSSLGVTFPLFIYGFEKDLLMLNFIFLIAGFYFWIFWKLELSEASYNPKFELNQLSLLPDQRITLKISQKAKTYKAILSNWDVNSCFMILEHSWEEIRGLVEIELYFEGRVFVATGKVVSHYGPGIGLKFLKEESSETLNWRQFYDIISDRGFI